MNLENIYLLGIEKQREMTAAGGMENQKYLHQVGVRQNPFS
jgi:hypothetical protein